MHTKAYLILLFLLSLIIGNGYAQNQNPYGLKIISTEDEYRKCISQDDDQELIDIQKFIPEIVLDIRYATAHNFTGQAVYPSARAFARKPVVMQLKAIQEELKSKKLGLKIYDAYRPYAISVKFYDVYLDSTFVASPRKGSRHNRGAAIDLTLIDLQTRNELEMTSQFDDFSDKAIPDYKGGTAIQNANRKILIETMAKHGFIVYSSEWWHYDFNDWQKFGLMDLSFEQLDAIH
ncbi:D-alanyl-D-alanine dipeptidase [Aquipluma nitroreducens]|uniref:D-alanyl-D-alanine dipeptidase n=1 Tax=Aquipluma nitroreducens TaxID=2010828 RepID=A0A5K7S9R8_9BACT|nr:M15 family metallopeptidase [Aquipluma nitroreducens]BBE18312.1 D-alanyl-D-alanine dipeptidase [Aquipluma nitroreducens]